jgi:Lrp/AsnC family transcriptional regulator for asnA, asnC and gidA
MRIMPIAKRDSMQLDKLDESIIIALAENGRRAYRDIGRDLGVSEAAVRQRVRRLSDEGLIRITAIGDFQALGFDTVAMVNLRVPPALVEPYAALISEFAEVRFVSIAMGSADIIFQSIHANPARLPEILSMDVFPLGKTIKSSWSWSAWFQLKDRNA